MWAAVVDARVRAAGAEHSSAELLAAWAEAVAEVAPRCPCPFGLAALRDGPLDRGSSTECIQYIGSHQLFRIVL